MPRLTPKQQRAKQNLTQHLPRHSKHRRSPRPTGKRRGNRLLRWLRQRKDSQWQQQEVETEPELE